MATERTTTNDDGQSYYSGRTMVSDFDTMSYQSVDTLTHCDDSDTESTGWGVRVNSIRNSISELV